MFKWWKRRKESKENEKKMKELAAYLAKHPDRMSITNLLGMALGKNIPFVEELEKAWQDKQRVKDENDAKPNPKIFKVSQNLEGWLQRIKDSEDSQAGHSLLWLAVGDLIPETKEGKWSLKLAISA